MSNPRAGVRRNGAQNLRFPGVTLVFQLHPGTHGNTASRGIGGVPYNIYISERLAFTGQTSADGEVSVPLRQTETEFHIEIFGARTRVNVTDTPSALSSPPHMEAMVDGDTNAALVGITERLILLGYLNQEGGQNAMGELVGEWSRHWEDNDSSVSGTATHRFDSPGSAF